MDKTTTIPAAILAVGKVTAKCVAMTDPANGWPPAAREAAETILAIIRQCEPPPAGDGLPIAAGSFPDAPMMNGEVERLIRSARAVSDRVGCGSVIAPMSRGPIMAEIDAMRDALRAVGG